MEADYWHQKWTQGSIGFHQKSVNKRLVHYWPTLLSAEFSSGLSATELTTGPNPRVFVPLCGKSLDMLWLHEQGHDVLGVELSEKAAEAFFVENDLAFDSRRDGEFDVFSGTGKAQGIVLLAGDFFALTPEQLHQCGAFYDRASLIAMNNTFRTHYAEHLARILPAGATGLLLSISYDQEKMNGPPFSVPDEMVHELLQHYFTIQQLAHYTGPNRLGNLAERGLETLDERVYLLKRHVNDSETS